MRLKVRWLNSALIASKPRAIAMIGVTSPTMLMNENGIGSGVIDNRRRNRNGLCPIVSRMVVAENQARTRATRNTSASTTTIRAPPRWSAVSFATTVPSPVQGEPCRRAPGDPPGRLLSGIAGLLEIAVVNLGEARRRKMDPDQFDFRGEAARDLGPQIALAVDPIAFAPERLQPHDTGHRGEAVGDGAGSFRAARLDIDDMAATKHPAGELGHRAGQRDAAAVEQRDSVADALHLVEMVRRQQYRRSIRLQAADHLEKFLRRMG